MAGNSTLEAGGGDIRPMVRTAGNGNAGLWAFLAILLVGGYFLFSTLQDRRMEMTAPATSFDDSYGSGRISALPPLNLSDAFLAEPAELPPPPPAATAVMPPAPPVITRYVEIPAPAPAPAVPAAVEPALPRPAVFYDATVSPVRTEAAAAGDEDRVTATRLKNPSLTVPKGTVIPVVLESALDSTRPGFIRAIVSRDVKSFDGSRTLIPRGSRIYGEYASDLNYGQNRALVSWDRLLRPDGVMIGLGSPAADPLGRAGVRGKVNNHFFARFGAAILQSSLDIGVGLATRRVVGDGVIVALPGSNQTVGQSGSGGVGQMATEGMAPVGPTLTVRQGTAVSVFVARDLDFSTVEK